MASSHMGGVPPLLGSCIEQARVSPNFRALAVNGTTGPVLEIIAGLIDRGLVYDSVKGAAVSGGRLAGEGTVRILGHIANVCRVHCVAAGATSMMA